MLEFFTGMIAMGMLGTTAIFIYKTKMIVKDTKKVISDTEEMLKKKEDQERLTQGMNKVLNYSEDVARNYYAKG